MRYEEIGQVLGDHQWYVRDQDIYILNVGGAPDKDYEDCLSDCWRGRYDHASWKCSIVPSEECRCLTEPPDSLIEKLRERFEAVSAFYFFGGGKDDVEPLAYKEMTNGMD